MTISVAVNTRNAARTLALALESVHSWVDEIVVGDMASDDGTPEIAQQMGARVVPVEPSTHVEPARRTVLDHCRGDWILCLDADELVPVTLAARLQEIARLGLADAVTIAMRNFIFGAALSHTTWEMANDLHLRFFRIGAVTFSDRIHSAPSVVPGARHLYLPATTDLALVHLSHRDIADFVEKMNRYTSVEAAERQALGDTATWRGLARALVHEVGAQQISHRAFLEGERGNIVTVLMCVYRWLTWVKLRELRAVGTRSDIEARYAQIAERTLAGYQTSDLEA